jgi:hypothetical protein
VADIKLTLSTEARNRAPTIEAEATWLAREGKLYYPLSGRPRRGVPGCWVYFIRAGELVARARAMDFRRMESSELGGSYTGVPQDSAGWHVAVIPPMELATRRVPHEGFQGFRYVSQSDAAQFEKAFEQPAV